MIDPGRQIIVAEAIGRGAKVLSIETEDPALPVAAVVKKIGMRQPAIGGPQPVEDLKELVRVRAPAVRKGGHPRRDVTAPEPLKAHIEGQGPACVNPP